MEKIGKKLQNWRNFDEKVTQIDLAKKLGVGQTTISNAERGNEAALEKVLFLIERTYEKKPSYFGYNENEILREEKVVSGKNDETQTNLIAIQRQLIEALQENKRLESQNRQLRDEISVLKLEIGK